MGKFIDLTGQTFGKWTVLERAESYKCGNKRWLCGCKCGREKIVDERKLRTVGSTQCNRCAATGKSNGSGVVYEIRKKLGLTQEGMAARSGISVGGIRKAETEGRFFSDNSSGVAAQIKFNKAFPEFRQERPLFKPYVNGGEKTANRRVVPANCCYCGALISQLAGNANRGSKPSCSRSHATLYRHHGPLKHEAPKPAPRYIGTDYERVREPRKLDVGLKKVLRAQRERAGAAS